MNLTGQTVYVKTERSNKRPSASEKRHMDKVAKLPCIVGPLECDYRGRSVMLHHCGTHMGKSRNHKKVLPLCWNHHTGPLGIDGKVISAPKWEAKYGTENELLEKLKLILEK